MKFLLFLMPLNHCSTVHPKLVKSPFYCLAQRCLYTVMLFSVEDVGVTKYTETLNTLSLINLSLIFYCKYS